MNEEVCNKEKRNKKVNESERGTEINPASNEFFYRERHSV